MNSVRSAADEAESAAEPLFRSGSQDYFADELQTVYSPVPEPDEVGCDSCCCSMRNAAAAAAAVGDTLQ